MLKGINGFIYSHLSDWVSEKNTWLENRLDNPERGYFPLPEVGRLISVYAALAAIWCDVEFDTSKDSTLGVPSTTFDKTFRISGYFSRL
jgi:hypothetical protein